VVMASDPKMEIDAVPALFIEFLVPFALRLDASMGPKHTHFFVASLSATRNVSQRFLPAQLGLEPERRPAVGCMIHEAAAHCQVPSAGAPARQNQARPTRTVPLNSRAKAP
jgi:hypothetical protein